MPFAICNEIFQGWKLDDVFPFVKQVGYDAVEIAPFTIAQYVTSISKSEREHIRLLASKHSLQISGIHWVLVQTEGLHLTHPDSEVRRRTSQYFCELVDFCADIGGQHIVVGSPKQRNVIDGISYEQAWGWATEVFQQPVKKAQQRECVICFEPLAPSETNFINTAEEAIRFIDQFATPNIKIILDVKAMCSEAKSIPDIIRQSSGRFAYFHANDRNLKGPGFGDVDFHPIATALKDSGYGGYVSVEVFKFEDGAEMIATKSLHTLQHAFRVS